jgi:hypothetical protein
LNTPFLEKLSGAQLINKFLAEGSLLPSQDPATGWCPEAV